MQPFGIPSEKLKTGHNHFEWRADGQFFKTFGDSGILDADISIDLDVNFHGVTADVECAMKGTVTVECDRCLEDLVLPVETGFEDSVVADEDGLDFSQDIYDYVLLSLPLRKVHPEGECNEETVKYIK
ncbi:MAG: DUF177 domain-containing protein [Bacteroidales bacterium]|nr:DUF177 domain-containing protein [Bacteroidales bacterium]